MFKAKNHNATKYSLLSDLTVIHPFGEDDNQRDGLKCQKMKDYLLKLTVLLVFFVNQFDSVKATDSTKISVSLNYSRDLSDTYGGGNLFSGETSISFSWFGVKGSFGHLNSQYYSLLEVPYSEIGGSLEIYIPEISFMNLGSVSLFLRPVEKKWITMDVVAGASIAQAKSFFIKNVEYEYDLEEERFTYVFTDYHYVRNNHLGYHVGLDITVYLLKNIGIQLSSRIHDMNHGSFFFIGSGLCFKL